MGNINFLTSDLNIPSQKINAMNDPEFYQEFKHKISFSRHLLKL
jgi:hypothetical protein